MISTIWATLVLGFVLGMEHALDADHVVAVSTIVSRERRPMRAALAGTFWGIGHTISLFLVGILVIVFRVTIPKQVAFSLEALVGVMLVSLGGQILWDYWRKLLHVHSHGPGRTHIHFHVHSKEHNHHRGSPIRKTMLIGMIHGLAGSAALMLLVLSTIDTVLEGVVYVLIFGVGSILGMMIISTAIGLPFLISADRFGNLNRKIRLLTGMASIILGVLVIIQTGFVAGLISSMWG